MSLRISASGEYARLTSNLPSTTSFTVAGRFYVVNDRTGQYRFLFGLENATTNATAWKLLGWESDNSFKLSVHSGAAAALSAPPNGQWVYGYITCSGTGAGSLTAAWWDPTAGGGSGAWVTASRAGVSFTPAMLTLGNDSYDEWCDVRLEHFRLWNVTKSAAAMLAEKDSATAVDTTGLIGDWPLGSDANDVSGAGHHLTTGGAISWEAGSGIGAGASLTVADLTHAHAEDAPTLSVGVSLTPADAAHAQAVESPALEQHSTLSVADATLGHSVESPDVSGVGLGVQAAAHGHGLEAPALVQANVLTASDLAHSHGLEVVVLQVGGALVVADASHGQALDAAALLQAHLLAVQEVAHGHAADSPTLSESVQLAIADALHGQGLEALDLSTGDQLAVAEMLHAHAADGATLTQANVLVLADLLQAQGVDAVSFNLYSGHLSAASIRSRPVLSATIRRP